MMSAAVTAIPSAARALSEVTINREAVTGSNDTTTRAAIVRVKDTANVITTTTVIDTTAAMKGADGWIALQMQ
jgi:hypothetical protein